MKDLPTSDRALKMLLIDQIPKCVIKVSDDDVEFGLNINYGIENRYYSERMSISNYNKFMFPIWKEKLSHLRIYRTIKDMTFEQVAEYLGGFLGVKLLNNNIDLYMCIHLNYEVINGEDIPNKILDRMIKDIRKDYKELYDKDYGIFFI